MKKNINTPDGAINYFILGNRNSSAKYLILAGKHGNEPESVVMAEEYIMPYLRKNNYFGKFFIILPNLNPLQIGRCLEAIETNQSFEHCRRFRLNKNKIDLNADYPTKNSDTPSLRAEQTKLVISLHEEYNFDLILDFHTNGASHMNIYKYDNEVGRYLARGMNRINSVVARDYVHHKNKGVALSGTSGTYFGKERNVPIITVELGARKYIKRPFNEHCQNLWDLHKPALRYLFADVMPDENDEDYQDYVRCLGEEDDDGDGCGTNGISAT